LSADFDLSNAPDCLKCGLVERIHGITYLLNSDRLLLNIKINLLLLANTRLQAFLTPVKAAAVSRAVFTPAATVLYPSSVAFTVESIAGLISGIIPLIFCAASWLSSGKKAKFACYHRQIFAVLTSSDCFDGGVDSLDIRLAG